MPAGCCSASASGVGSRRARRATARATATPVAAMAPPAETEPIARLWSPPSRIGSRPGELGVHRVDRRFHFRRPGQVPVAVDRRPGTGWRDPPGCRSRSTRRPRDERLHRPATRKMAPSRPRACLRRCRSARLMIDACISPNFPDPWDVRAQRTTTQVRAAYTLHGPPAQRSTGRPRALPGDRTNTRDQPAPRSRRTHRPACRRRRGRRTCAWCSRAMRRGAPSPGYLLTAIAAGWRA